MSSGSGGLHKLHANLITQSEKMNKTQKEVAIVASTAIAPVYQNAIALDSQSNSIQIETVESDQLLQISTIVR